MPRVKLFDQNEVLEKAMILFWKKGYNATSIQDLVNHLGINRGSIYDTYGGKKELFRKAYGHYRDSSQERTRAFLFGYDNVKTGFKKLFEQTIEEALCDADNKGCFTVNSSVEFIEDNEDFTAILAGSMKNFKELFYEYLATGVEKNQISANKDLQVLASLFFTFYNGLMVVTKTNFDAKVISKSVDELLCVME